MEKKKTVLVVDDDETILRTFTYILSRNGYDTDNAKSGREAMEKLQNNNYDLALIDINLQDANGIDLLSKMQEKAASMVRIIITGSPTADNRRKATENGADAYLEKPIKIKELLGTITAKLEETKTRKTM